MTTKVSEVRVREVHPDFFKREVRRSRVLSQDADGNVMLRRGSDLLVLMPDPTRPDGWFRGMDRGHFARAVAP